MIDYERKQVKLSIKRGDVHKHAQFINDIHQREGMRYFKRNLTEDIPR